MRRQANKAPRRRQPAATPDPDRPRRPCDGRNCGRSRRSRPTDRLAGSNPKSGSQFFAELAEFRSDQSAHGEPFLWSDYLTIFAASTLENLKSEWLQLVFQAVLLIGAKHLIYRVDGEDLERLEAKVGQINHRLADQK